MKVSTRNTLLFILGVCLLSLGAAYYSQYYLDLKPCILCLYQRYMLMGIGGLAVFGLLTVRRFGLYFVFISAFGYLINAGIGIFQVLIEKGVVETPAMCKKAVVSDDLAFEEFVDQIMDTATVACDEVTWDLFGISFAGYSVMYSLLMGLLCLVLGVLLYGQKRIR